MSNNDINTVSGMARVLRVSRQTVYNLHKAGKMPYATLDAEGKLSAPVADLMRHKIRRDQETAAREARNATD